MARLKLTPRTAPTPRLTLWVPGGIALLLSLGFLGLLALLG